MRKSLKRDLLKLIGTKNKKRSEKFAEYVTRMVADNLAMIMMEEFDSKEPLLKQYVSVVDKIVSYVDESYKQVEEKP